jgi:hypothetical protein
LTRMREHGGPRIAEIAPRSRRTIRQIAPHDRAIPPALRDFSRRPVARARRSRRVVPRIGRAAATPRAPISLNPRHMRATSSRSTRPRRSAPRNTASIPPVLAPRARASHRPPANLLEVQPVRCSSFHAAAARPRLLRACRSMMDRLPAASPRAALRDALPQHTR